MTAYFKITANLTFTGTDDCASMIGSDTNPFYGSIDGNNLTIDNFKCDADSPGLASKDYIGLIRKSNGLEIKDLNIDSFAIQGL